MNSLPATSNVNRKPCSSLNINNPRSECQVCNEQTLEQSKPTESQFNKTTNTAEDRLSLDQREKLFNRAGCEDSTETNGRLGDVCSYKDKQNTEQGAALYSTKNEEDLKTDSQVEQYHRNNCDETCSEMKNIQDYLDEDIENCKEFLVPEKILKNKVLLMGKCARAVCIVLNKIFVLLFDKIFSAFLNKIFVSYFPCLF